MKSSTTILLLVALVLTHMALLYPPETGIYEHGVLKLFTESSLFTESTFLFVAALVLTLLAFLYLPETDMSEKYRGHKLFTDMTVRGVHWPTLVVELVAVWVGFYIATAIMTVRGVHLPTLAAELMAIWLGFFIISKTIPWIAKAIPWSKKIF